MTGLPGCVEKQKRLHTDSVDWQHTLHGMQFESLLFVCSLFPYPSVCILAQLMYKAKHK